MRFLKARAEHVWHIAHWWWAVIYGTWTLLCSFDVIVEHYGSDSFRAAYNSWWITPKWGAKTWLIGLLVITVLAILEGSYQYAHRLQLRLDGAPKLVCKGVSSHGNPLVMNEVEMTGSPLVATTRQRIVGTPTFYHMKIANEPVGTIDRKTAEKVAARVQVFHENGTPAADERLHRWEDSPGPVEAGKQADRMVPLDIPPSGVEYNLDIAMKYENDDAFYTPNNETALQGIPGWREKQFEFPPGTYIAKIRLQGTNVVSEIECRIVNKGKGSQLEITPLRD
jgi:hypothetical protein